MCKYCFKNLFGKGTVQLTGLGKECVVSDSLARIPTQTKLLVIQALLKGNAFARKQWLRSDKSWQIATSEKQDVLVKRYGSMPTYLRLQSCYRSWSKTWVLKKAQRYSSKMQVIGECWLSLGQVAILELPTWNQNQGQNTYCLYLSLIQISIQLPYHFAFLIQDVIVVTDVFPSQDRSRKWWNWLCWIKNKEQDD